MKKKNIIQLAALLICLSVAGVFLFSSHGGSLTPLTKVFIIFFGGIVGFQAIPAVLLFTAMFRGLFGKEEGSSLKHELRQ